LEDYYDDDDLVAAIDELASRRNLRGRFSMKELFGDQWERAPGDAKRLGRRIAKLARNGQLHSIQEAGINTNGRMNMYRRKR
jgi:hypothetical protein